MNFDNKMIEDAKAAKSAKELFELAKANGVEITEEDASAYFEQLNPKCGELEDDELNNVSGGGCGGYASASLNGHYYKLVNDRTDSCGRFSCLICGGSHGQHAAGCPALDNSMGADVSNKCMNCIHRGGHRMIGSYCKLDWK